MKARPFLMGMMRCLAVAALLLLQAETSAQAQARTSNEEMSVQPPVKPVPAASTVKSTTHADGSKAQRAMPSSPAAVEAPFALPAPAGATMRAGKHEQQHRVDPEELPVENRNP